MALAPPQPRSLKSRTVAGLLALLGLLSASSTGTAGGTRSRAFARGQMEREFSRTIPLASGKRLLVDHANGEVAVKAHAGPEVTIHDWIRASANPQGEAREFSASIRIEVVPDAGGVTVKTLYPERSGSGSFNVSYSVDYEIGMPASALLEVRNRFGSISASGVKGGTRIECSNGSVTLKDGSGPQLVTSSFCAIDIRAAAVTVSGGNGDVTLGDLGAVSVTTSFGAVRFTNVKMTCVGSNGAITGTKNAPACRTPCRSTTERLHRRQGVGRLERGLQAHRPEDVVRHGEGVAPGGRQLHGGRPDVLLGHPERLSALVRAAGFHECHERKIGSGRCELAITNANGGIHLLNTGPRK